VAPALAEAILERAGHHLELPSMRLRSRFASALGR
jgi:hypothetical protein